MFSFQMGMALNWARSPRAYPGDLKYLDDCIFNKEINRNNGINLNTSKFPK